MRHAATRPAMLAKVRAALRAHGYVGCATPGCTVLVAPAENETGPVVCPMCEMKATHKRGMA